MKAKPWCIAWRGVDGKLHKEKTDAPTKELAKKLLSKRLVEVTEAKVAGVKVERTNVAFDGFLKEYVAHIEARKTEASRRRDECSIARLKTVFGSFRLKDFTTGMVQKYVDDRMHEKTRYGRTPRPATINRELMCLSAIFREAVKRDYVDRNPVRGVRQMAEQNQMLRYLSDEEEAALLKVCNAGLRPVVICALHTGMRREEILSLTWECVDLDERLVCVRFSKSKKKRFIPINEELLELLKSLSRLKDCPYVFANPETRDRWCDQKVAWAYAVRKSKVKGIRFHDLRHTFASRLMQRGVPLKAVQELLGHGSIVMTMRYAHLAPGDLRHAVELLSRKITTQSATQVEGAKQDVTSTDAKLCGPTGSGEGDGARTRNLWIDNPLL